MNTIITLARALESAARSKILSLDLHMTPNEDYEGFLFLEDVPEYVYIISEDGQIRREDI